MKKILLLPTLFACLSTTFASHAEDILIVADNFPIFSQKTDDNKLGGIGGEILTEAFKEKISPSK